MRLPVRLFSCISGTAALTFCFAVTASAAQLTLTVGGEPVESIATQTRRFGVRSRTEHRALDFRQACRR